MSQCIGKFHTLFKLEFFTLLIFIIHICFGWIFAILYKISFVLIVEDLCQLIT